LKKSLAKLKHRWKNNIKMNLQKYVLRMWTGFILLRIESIGGSHEHGNEPSGSAKCGKFLDTLSSN
jgi:hypothetical protein